MLRREKEKGGGYFQPSFLSYPESRDGAKQEKVEPKPYHSFQSVNRLSEGEQEVDYEVATGGATCLLPPLPTLPVCAVQPLCMHPKALCFVTCRSFASHSLASSWLAVGAAPCVCVCVRVQHPQQLLFFGATSSGTGAGYSP